MRKQQLDLVRSIVKPQPIPKKARCALATCGKTFKPKVFWQRYCQTSHRVIAYQNRIFTAAVVEAMRQEKIEGGKSR